MQIEDIIRRYIYFPLARYLSFFAAKLIKRANVPVIAVTGSSGKSSMIELIATILDENKTTYIYPKKANSALGLPIYLLGLHSADVNGTLARYIRWIQIIFLAPIKGMIQKLPQTEEIIIEMDSDRPGEMKSSAQLLHPNFSIWLNTGITHALYHDNAVKTNQSESIIDSIASDFAQILSYTKGDGVSIVNIDDPMVEKYTTNSKAQLVKIGKRSTAVNLQSYTLESFDSHFHIHISKRQLQNELKKEISKAVWNTWMEDIHIQIHNFLLPEHYYYIFASAVIFSLYHNISYGVFMSALTKYRLPPGRMSVFEGINQTNIIDSTYNNANPQSLIEAIDMVAKYKQNTVILGDMRELGNEAKEAHEQIAQELIHKKIQTILLTGENMYKYVLPYLTRHNITAHAFKTTRELKEYLINSRYGDIKPGNMILVKGSQNTIFLESIVELLLKNRKDAKLLCRRGELWDERRKSIGL